MTMKDVLFFSPCNVLNTLIILYQFVILCPVMVLENNLYFILPLDWCYVYMTGKKSNDKTFISLTTVNMSSMDNFHGRLLTSR